VHHFLLLPLQVMVFDVHAQEVNWCTEPGHTETVFDCCFAPHNMQLLATCSFDATVRVWDVATSTCIKTFDYPRASKDSPAPAGAAGIRQGGQLQVPEHLSIKLRRHQSTQAMSVPAKLSL